MDQVLKAGTEGVVYRSKRLVLHDLQAKLRWKTGKSVPRYLPHNIQCLSIFTTSQLFNPDEDTWELNNIVVCSICWTWIELRVAWGHLDLRKTSGTCKLLFSARDADGASIFGSLGINLRNLVDPVGLPMPSWAKPCARGDQMLRKAINARAKESSLFVYD